MAIVIPAKLTEEQAWELAETLAEFRKFCKLLRIYNKKKRRMETFEPTPEQWRLFEALMTHNRVLVLKARQIGVSTLVRAYFFWKQYIAEEPLAFGVVSYSDRSAKEMRTTDQRFYDGLPKVLQRKLSINNTQKTVFADSEASSASFTAGGRNSTRSFVLSDAHVTEFAFFEDPEELLASLDATVGTEGQVVIETTPNQPGDYYHQLCIDAERGANEWHLFATWWWQHPSYRATVRRGFVPTEEELEQQEKYGLDFEQLQWRRTKMRTLSANPQKALKKFRREYPACIEDAFHFADNVYFDPTDIEAIEEVEEPTADPGLLDEEWVLETPDPDGLYCAGIDVGGGLNKDYSVLVILNAMTLAPALVARTNKLKPEDFAEVAAEYLGMYNNPLVITESNNHGHVVLLRFKQMRVPNQWLRPENGKDWVTSLRSKLEAYAALDEAVENHLIPKLPDVACRELKSLVVPEGKKAPEAPKTKQGVKFMHDDIPMALALAYRAHKDVPKEKIRALKRKQFRDMLRDERRRSSQRSRRWRPRT